MIGGLALDDIPLFRGIAAAELGELLDQGVATELAAGRELLVEGERGDALFVVVAGRVQIAVGGHVLGELGAGACVGEMSLVTNQPASATVIALTGCRVVRFARAAFARALGEIAALGVNLGAILAHRLRETSRRAEVARASFTPIIAPADRLADARRVAAWLAASLARHGQHQVAVVDLAAPTALVGLEAQLRAARVPGAGWRVLAGAPDAAALHALCDAFAVVVAIVPADAELPPLRVLRAYAILGAQGPAGAHLLQLGRAASRRAELALSRAHGGRPCTIIPLRDDNTPPVAIDRLAREAYGMRVGVALGAGGTRGFTHVGVLEALHARGVPIDCLAGTSIGSVVGALWALGHSGDDITAMVAETRRYLLRLTVPTRSLLSNRGIRAHIERSAAGRAFEDSPIPLAAVAADLHDGSRVAIASGDLAPAILASSSIPGIFPPVTIGGRVLVDGGICEPVPTTSVFELGAQVIIGVSLGIRAPRGPRTYNVVSTLLRTNEIMQALVDDRAAVRSDVLIAPLLDGGAFQLPDRDSAEQFRAAGRAAADAALPRLRAILPWLEES